jgi:predicted DNA-binding transcriptional regulator YafY
MAGKDYDKTLTRLIGILSKLSLNQLPSMHELAEEYNVTIRTIQKDIYQRLIAFPIEKNVEGRLCFSEGFSLNKSLLGAEEMILVSLSLAQFDGVEHFEKISQNILKKLLYPKLFNPYFIKQQKLEPLKTNSKIFNNLKTAIQEQTIVKILFDEYWVEVEPYKLTNFDGFWYLFAKDIEAKKIKTWMLSKIERIQVSQEHYKTSIKQIDATLNHVHSAWFEDGQVYEVTIKVHAEIAHYFKQKEFLQSQKILRTLDDGSLHVAFEVSHDEDVDNMIKAWLPHIEVIAPKRYRDKVLAEMQAYVDRLKQRH